MNYCFIRLGKSSVGEIKRLDEMDGFQEKHVSIVVSCTQVPHEAKMGTYCFIWLGSDNNKGLQTNWKQGLRAFGIISSKGGGPKYGNRWTMKVQVLFVFGSSIGRSELLRLSPQTFTGITDMPIVGIESSSNQTVQLIKPSSSEYQDLDALTKLLDSHDNRFIPAMAQAGVPLGSHGAAGASAREITDTVFDEPEDRGGAAISHSFDPGEIDIRPQPLTIISIIKRLETKPMRIDLNTEFQRGQDLWSLENQSRLIESLLVKIPLPAFYFDGTADTWLIVDGLQRISTLRNFILLKKLRLTGLEYLREFEGFSWDELPSHLRSRIEETPVTAYIINPGTPEDVKFNIFKRINTSGLSLNSQEIRNALNNGIPSQFVAKLAGDQLFISAMGGKVPTTRMQDKDYVTRFLGFYLDESNYQPDLDGFLNSGMAKLKKMDEGQRELIASDFGKAMKFARSIFGAHAFRKRNSANRRMPINKALFECTAVILAKLKYKDLLTLETRRDIINKKMETLLTSNKAFIDAISSGTGDIKAVQKRYAILRELFSGVIYERSQLLFEANV
jgi:hypothetical protein